MFALDETRIARISNTRLFYGTSVWFTPKPRNPFLFVYINSLAGASQCLFALRVSIYYLQSYRQVVVAVVTSGQYGVHKI